MFVGGWVLKKTHRNLPIKAETLESGHESFFKNNPSPHRIWGIPGVMIYSNNNGFVLEKISGSSNHQTTNIKNPPQAIPPKKKSPKITHLPSSLHQQPTTYLQISIANSGCRVATRARSVPFSSATLPTSILEQTALAEATCRADKPGGWTVSPAMIHWTQKVTLHWFTKKNLDIQKFPYIMVPYEKSWSDLSKECLPAKKKKNNEFFPFLLQILCFFGAILSETPSIFAFRFGFKMFHTPWGCGWNLEWISRQKNGTTF